MLDAALLADADMSCGDLFDEGNMHNTICFFHRVVLVNQEDKFLLTGSKHRGYSVRWLIRRSFWEKHNLKFPEGWIIEDLPVILQAVWLANRIVTVPGAVYYYAKRQGSTLNETNRDFVKKRFEHWLVTRDFRDEFLASHDLKNTVNTGIVQKFKIKVIGIPMGKKFVFASGRVRWYLLGMRVMQKMPGKLPKYR
jgi:CDP-glycerol glycerophosphotransferase